MVYSCRATAVLMCVLFSVTTASVMTIAPRAAHAGETSAKPASRTAKRPPGKKKKAAKKKVTVEAAAAVEPTAPEPEPEPVKEESSPSKSETAKSETAKSEEAPKSSEPAKDPWRDSSPASSVRTELGPPGDKPQEDRSATQLAAKKPISIAPLLGFATQGLKLGFGIRAGYTIPVGGTREAPSGNGVYVGGTFVYHLGTSEESSFASYSINAFYPAGEVGYELRPTDRLTIRPYGGIGMMFFRTYSKTKELFTDKVKEETRTYEAAAFYPGCALHYDVSSMFVGGDARLLIPFEGGGTSFGIFATGGIRF